jgi:lipoprotein NlpD
MERITRTVCYQEEPSRFTVQNYLLFFLLTISALLLLVSCSNAQVRKDPPKGIYHVVKKGETAYGIARAYSIRLRDLAEINQIVDVSNIKEGSVLFIPHAEQLIDDAMGPDGKIAAGTKKKAETKDGTDAEKIKVAKPAEQPGVVLEKSQRKQNLSKRSGVAPAEKKETGTDKKTSPAENKQEIKPGKGIFIWPVKGTVKTQFGLQQNKTYHNWIKIACREGTKVKAAASGTVIFSASLKEFGETIIIRHDHDLATVYTHLNKRYIQADQNVKKGGSIGLAGEKDEMGDVFINFEIRFKSKPRNPLLYLP